jgi:hypothetical protein
MQVGITQMPRVEASYAEEVDVPCAACEIVLGGCIYTMRA